MKRNPWKLTTFLFAGLLGATIAGSSIPSASARPQPLMKDALHDLQTARATLQAAAPDKGGHRVKALGLVDRAIIQVRMGIRAGNR